MNKESGVQLVDIVCVRVLNKMGSQEMVDAYTKSYGNTIK